MTEVDFAGPLPTILWEDEYCFVVNKPAWLLVHRGRDRNEVTLADWVYDVLERKPHPLHRLDRQTSGVMLFAKTPEIAAKLRFAFDDRIVTKVYYALVRGVPKESKGLIDHPIPKSEGGERIDAQSEWRLIQTAQTEPRHVSWVEVRPKTGRFHQVRRHMSHLHHPIINDSNYGDTKVNRAIRERYGLERMALHAAALTFPHPVDDQNVTVHAPLPEDLSTPLTKMGILL